MTSVPLNGMSARDNESTHLPQTRHEQQMQLNVLGTGQPTNPAVRGQSVDGDVAPTPLETREDDSDEYPEGGTQAWLVVAGAWCAMIPSMGFLNTLAALEAWISENQLQGYSASSVGWIISLYAFFLYIGGAQVGPIFDAYDARFLIVPGSVGMIAAIFCLSVSQEYYQLLLSFGVLGGISASFLFTPAISTIGHWFQKRRAPTGIACTAGGAGGIVFPLIILYAAPAIGFGWAMRIIGFISIFTSIAACLLLRKRLPHNKKAGATVDFKALTDVNYALTTFSIFLVEFAVFIPYTYISTYAIHVGIGTQRAYLLNVLLNTGAIPGRALPGYLADRFGTFNVMCSTTFVCASFIFALWLTAGSSEPAIIAFSIIYGFWSGAAISLTPVCISRVCKIEDYGKRSGTTFSLTSVAALIGVPIAGAILEGSGGSYTGLIIFAGGVYAASFLAFAITRVVAGGKRWTIF